jgi:hypothetical protein
MKKPTINLIEQELEGLQKWHQKSFPMPSRATNLQAGGTILTARLSPSSC